MIIKLTRAFERTRQIADFVPIKAYCEATMEFQVESQALVKGASETASMMLDNIVQSEVDKTLKNYYPMCIGCGGKGVTVSLNKEGMCGQCVSAVQFKARDLRKEIGTPAQKVEKKQYE